MTGQLQHMVSHPDSNNGFMLRLQDEQHYRCMLIASSNHPDPLLRPRLRIIFTECMVPEVDFNYEISGLITAFEGISPTAAFSYNLSDLTTYFHDGTDFATSWFWDFGDGYYSDLAEPWHEYEYPGMYNVCLITMNECDNDTICEDVHIYTVSISENDEVIYAVYPNPAKNEVNIISETEGALLIRLFDLGGKEIKCESTSMVRGESAVFDLENVNTGIYILKLESGYTSSFIKIAVVK